MSQPGHAMWDNRDLAHRVSARQGFCHQRMPCFVVRHASLLLWRHNMAFALWPGHEAINGFIELWHAHSLFVAPDSQEGRLIDHLGQLCAHHTWGACCNHL